MPKIQSTARPPINQTYYAACQPSLQRCRGSPSDQTNTDLWAPALTIPLSPRQNLSRQYWNLMMQHQNIDCARTQSSHLKSFPCPPLLSWKVLVTFQIMQPVNEFHSPVFSWYKLKVNCHPGGGVSDVSHVTSCVMCHILLRNSLTNAKCPAYPAVQLCQGPYGRIVTMRANKPLRQLCKKNFTLC